MSKKRIYITSSIMLGAVIVPSIAVFTYLNININPGIELVTNLNDNNALAYDSIVKIDAKLIRISDEHELEYRWYSKNQDSTEKTYLKEFDNKSSIEIKNQAIEKVNYFVELIDKNDEKKYVSKEIAIDYIQPNLYIDALINNRPFNPYLEKIPLNVNEIILCANLKEQDARDTHAIEGWFIYDNKSPNNTYRISELIENNNRDFSFVNSTNFEVRSNNPRKLLIKNLQSIKNELAKGYTIKYYWTNTNDQYNQNLELNFMI